MYRFYICLTIIIINGFIPSGKINAIYTLISWIIFTIQILWDLKYLNSKSFKIIPLILLLSLFGTVFYIYPYKFIYNFEAMKDVMITTLNSFFYLIIGLQFRIYLTKSLKQYKFNNKLEVINSVEEICIKQNTNLLMTILLIIVGPYIAKLFLFQEGNLYNFFTDNSIYKLPLIDFSSINFLSLSLKNSSRNSFLLIPLIFIFISYVLLKIIKKNEDKILKYSDQLNLAKLSNKIKISYILTYIFSVVYLICSSTRVGIFIGYSLLILFLFNWKILVNTNKEFSFFKITKSTESIIAKIICSFLILITIVPYQFFFPYSCRGEVSYNSILINSTLPIMHEFQYIIKKIRGQDLPSMQTLCKNPKYFLSDNIHFSEYNSSSFSDRWKTYTSDKICNDDGDCTPLIAHESLIRDILYPFKLVKLTIPLSILCLIIWLSIFFKYFYATFNRKKTLTNDSFKIKSLDNLVPIIGSIYFLLNSVNSPGASICFGIFYIYPTIKLINSKII